MENCKERISERGWGRTRSCTNKAKSDGFCGIHHPDKVKERQEKATKKYKEKWVHEKKQKITMAISLLINNGYKVEKIDDK